MSFKYKELRNAEWLYQRYVVEQLSSEKISKIVGCHKDTVILALRRYGIQIRDPKLARRLVPLQSFKFKQLNDEKWLREKYLSEGLSTFTIAKLVGGKSGNSTRQALLRFGIPLRSISDGLTINRESDGFVLNDITKEIIEGGLLGDAHIKSWNPHSDGSYPSFIRRNKFKDHVQWVANLLGGSLMAKRVTDCIEQCNGRRIRYHRFTTLTHQSLLPIYRRWYKFINGKLIKVVPFDLVLTKASLLHWFLDDGSTSWRKRKYPAHWIQRKKQSILSFSSESFTREENAFLCEQMLAIFGIKCRVIKVNFGTGWRTKVLQSNVFRFFDVIGECPVTSFNYKWKIPSRM